MYQNQNFNYQWFYAFITDIEWVNVNACKISYEIDVIQTWWFQYKFPKMFVERCHAEQDNGRDNVIPENLEYGEYWIQDHWTTGHFNDWYYVIWSTENLNNTESDFDVGGVYSGIYSGYRCYVYDDADSLQQVLKQLNKNGLTGAIVSINMFPKDFMGSIGAVSGTDEATAFEIEIPLNSPSVNVPNDAANLDGYVPRNKKLFNAPYNILLVTDFEGNGAIFGDQWFHWKSTLTATFKISMDITPNPTAICVPKNYKIGRENEGMYNWNEKLSMGGFPMCSWISNVYQAYLAQNASSLQVAGLTSAMGIAGQFVQGAVSGGVIGGVANAAGSILNVMSQVAGIEDKKAIPNQAHGSQSNTAMFANKQKDFHFIRMTISRSYAALLDDFFDMYGYRRNRVMNLNFYSREHWNYIKTDNATVQGLAPVDATRKMREILDTGVTFWHGDYVGNYTIGNDIRTNTAAEIAAQEARNAEE